MGTHSSTSLRISSSTDKTRSHHCQHPHNNNNKKKGGPQVHGEKPNLLPSLYKNFELIFVFPVSLRCIYPHHSDYLHPQNEKEAATPVTNHKNYNKWWLKVQDVKAILLPFLCTN
jgi:hypothetical protein